MGPQSSAQKKSFALLFYSILIWPPVYSLELKRKLNSIEIRQKDNNFFHFLLFCFRLCFELTFIAVFVQSTSQFGFILLSFGHNMMIEKFGKMSIHPFNFRGVAMISFELLFWSYQKKKKTSILVNLLLEFYNYTKSIHYLFHR